MRSRYSTILLLALPFLTLLACAIPGMNPSQPTRAAATSSPTSVVIPGTAATTATTAPPAPSATPAATVPAVTGTPTSTQTVLQPSLPATDPSLPSVELRFNSPQIAPDGILPQVDVFQAGGGGGSGETVCENKPGETLWCNPRSGGPLLLTQAYTATACGFGGGSLSALVLLPDGRSQPADVVETAAGEPLRCRSVSYLPGPTAPLGKYMITLSQNAARLTDTFQLTAPAGPTGVLLETCAWLVGLPQGQPVRLLAFGLLPPSRSPTPLQTSEVGTGLRGAGDEAPDPDLAVWRFLSETLLLPDPANGLLACPDAPSLARYPEFIYLAYPNGAAPVLLGDEDLLQQFQGVCGNGLLTRLAAGKKAHVMLKGLPLFSNPELNGQPLVLLNSGAALSILNGPACLPQGTWAWQVKTADGQTGWLAEANQTTYFLEPLP